MKKISLLTLVVMAGFTLHAQNTTFGLKGGLNLATWSNSNPDITYKNRVGFHAGLFSNINVSQNLAVQPEVVYSSQGTKYNDVSNREHNLSLNYINIPVMLQAKVGGGWYAQAGPQVGFLLSTADKVNNVETEFFTKEDFKTTDVAFGIGLGYSSPSALGIDARYNLGLTDINDAGGNNKLKNNVLQVGLTYKIGGRSSRY
jgi:opacity protein-like surface antigen